MVLLILPPLKFTHFAEWWLGLEHWNRTITIRVDLAIILKRWLTFLLVAQAGENMLARTNLSPKSFVIVVFDASGK